MCYQVERENYYPSAANSKYIKHENLPNIPNADVKRGMQSVLEMKDIGSSLARYNPTEIINIVGFHETKEFVVVERGRKLILHSLDPKTGISTTLNTCEICRAAQCQEMWPETSGLGHHVRILLGRSHSSVSASA